MYYGQKKNKDEDLKKTIARRKREKKRFSSYMFKPQWFGGVLFWVNDAGEPVKEITTAKKIPKLGKKATGLKNSF